MCKLGLVSVSFRKNTVEEIIKAVQQAGLQYIEWGSDVHAPYDDLAQINKIAELQSKFDIKCSSYGTYFRLGETPLELLPRYISVAKRLGTKTLRLWCGNKNSEDYSESEKLALFEECRAASEIARLQEVVLCMECHMLTYTNKLESALELMKITGNDNFKMYWQPSQFCDVEENIKYAAGISPYTKVIHVFNWKDCFRYKLAEGVDVWRSYLSNFDEKTPLLLEFMPDDKIESLQEEAATLKIIARRA